MVSARVAIALAALALGVGATELAVHGPRGTAAALAVFGLGGTAAAQETPRIVGVWVPAAHTVPDPLPLTDAARRALPAAAPAPPALPCAAPGMPALLDTQSPVEITQQGDRIRMRYAEWDATRTVYTNPRNGPPTQSPSSLGVSFGRWEGHTLAIFTTYIAYPYFDSAGTPQSAAVTVLERYMPSADRARLEWTVTVTDAATFTTPVVITGTMAAHGAATPAAALVAGGCVG